MLGVFKYFNFFSQSFRDIATAFGWHVDPVTLKVVLPVGISFYTFQSMSYVIDIYRRKFNPTEHFLEYAAYVSFLPQLMAGPIERASRLLPQFLKERTVTRSDLRLGLGLFFWGLYKKIVIADNLAPIADRFFSAPQSATRLELLAAVLAFTFQVYGDFSGYSDMARGLARILGFEIMVNFNLPYIARTPSDFWRRWHISLSTWLRDYLYISLGGSRKGAIRTYRNLSLTMLIGGLWHGASWHFVIWGAYHGFLLIIYRLLNVDARVSKYRAGLPSYKSSLLNAYLISTMFLLTCLGWILFRADSTTAAGYLLLGLFTAPTGSPDFLLKVLFYIGPLIFLEITQGYWYDLDFNTAYTPFIRYNVYLFIFCSIFFQSTASGKQFIYFDF
jgi:alginate O-acetyltransferase complex protein AlgI